MANIGDILLRVLLDGSSVQTDAQRIGNQAGQTMGQRLSGGLKAGMAFGAIAGGVTAALSPIATAADSALDNVRASTGLIGDELAGVQDVFRQVAGQVPDNLDTVSAVVSDLQTRTGLTGDALRTLSEQILDFSRATGTDAASNVASVTRLFGDWGIATEDQAGTLDRLLRASQTTGIGVDELMQKVTQFGAPLRQVGFSIDESAALLGKWEKEGVNTEAILGALKIGVGKFAREGISAEEGMRNFLAEMERLGPGAESLGLAVETFGSRAGPDMAAAVNEGRFAIDDFMEAIVNGGDTVASVTADTEDAADGFAGFLNTATLAVGEFAAPLAGFSEVAGPFLYALPLLSSAVGGLAGMITGVAVPALTTIGRVIMGLIAGTGPIGLIILAVGALFLAWETNFLGIRDIVDTIFGWIGDVALPWITGIFDAIAGAIGAAVGVITDVIGGIVGVVSGVADAIAGFFNWIFGETDKANAAINGVRDNQRSWEASQSVVDSGSLWEQERASRGFQSGAWSVPSTGPAIVHAGEMVVPSGAAAALRSWFGSGMDAVLAGGEGGDSSMTINFNVPPKEHSVRQIGETVRWLNRTGQLRPARARGEWRG